MLTALNKGDQIITSSGIYGKINKITEDKEYMLVEIADKTVVKMQKGQVADVVKSKPVKEVEEKKTESEKS